MIRVCVIGAGAAGLCMARQLTARKDLFEASVFERSRNVGGTWVYTESTGEDEFGLPIHSSMYKNLRTNLPKEVMAFPDFPFPSDLNSYVHHTAVQKYLEDYADNFNLRDVIHFHHNVVEVKPTDITDRNTQWKVTVQELETKEFKEQIYDAVVVCNGHFSVPYTPPITGLKTFPGHVVHSHHYRTPEEYLDKKVAILGAGRSGQDIAMEISQHATAVYLSHNYEPFKCRLPLNIHQVKGIEQVDEGGTVYFKDGKRHQVDRIILCTGYKYSFPFLTPCCGVLHSDFRVNLYKHLFNTRFPSMTFIGVTNMVCPFQQFNLQTLLILSVLRGQTVLPTQEEMEQAVENDFMWRVRKLGYKPKWAHFLGPLQWEYYDELSDLSKCQKIDPSLERLSTLAVERRDKYLMTYKNDNFKLTDSGTWELVPSCRELMT